MIRGIVLINVASTNVSVPGRFAPSDRNWCRFLDRSQLSPDGDLSSMQKSGIPLGCRRFFCDESGGVAVAQPPAKH